jgi:hypothetical protein
VNQIGCGKRLYPQKYIGKPAEGKEVFHFSAAFGRAAKLSGRELSANKASMEVFKLLEANSPFAPRKKFLSRNER